MSPARNKYIKHCYQHTEKLQTHLKDRILDRQLLIRQAPISQTMPRLVVAQYDPPVLRPHQPAVLKLAIHNALILSKGIQPHRAVDALRIGNRAVAVAIAIAVAALIVNGLAAPKGDAPHYQIGHIRNPRRGYGIPYIHKGRVDRRSEQIDVVHNGLPIGGSVDGHATIRAAEDAIAGGDAGGRTAVYFNVGIDQTHGSQSRFRVAIVGEEGTGIGILEAERVGGLGA